ncbi:response regulator [Neolewinella litorea]|nr:response regulator [Neolewinella litorea]
MSARHILLVEDNSTEAKLARRLLQKIDPNIRVTHLQDGEHFLKHCSQHPLEDVHLAIMDLHMPVRGGISVLENLRARHVRPSFPILIFSSSECTEEVQRVYELGASAFVTKPSDVDTYRLALQNIVNFWLSTNRLR